MFKLISTVSETKIFIFFWFAAWKLRLKVLLVMTAFQHVFPVSPLPAESGLGANRAKQCHIWQKFISHSASGVKQREGSSRDACEHPGSAPWPPTAAAGCGSTHKFTLHPGWAKWQCWAHTHGLATARTQVAGYVCTVLRLQGHSLRIQSKNWERNEVCGWNNSVPSANSLL